MIPQKDYEYATLMDLLHVSVSKHMLDEHFTVVWANRFYYDMIGYSEEEYNTQFYSRPDLYYAKTPELWEELGAKVAAAVVAGEGGYTLTARMPCKGGVYKWVQLRATFLDEYLDGCRLSYTTMTDVTDAMNMQKERSVTYDSLPGFVAKYTVTRDFQIKLLETSGRFVEFFGQEYAGDQKEALLRFNREQNGEAFAANREKLLAGEPAYFTVRVKNRQGKEAWLRVNASCIDWQGGDPVYLAIFIDVTDETELRQMQKKLEKALSLAEHANRAKSDFLSHMSHDIRTPMNAIVGMTDIARAHLDSRTKVEDCLKKISLSSQHLLGLINDVLDMSRIESNKMTINEDSMMLPELMENVIAMMRGPVKDRGQTLSVRLKNMQHERFCADALRLRQILINILSNASKFTAAGGGITFLVEELEMRDARVGVIRFTISDTGMGMSREFLDHLFEPFSREADSRVDKTEGSGLGMAITKKLVEILGGRIEVDSRVGEGTTFAVTLPMKVEEESPARTWSDMRIIVADDDDIMCEHMILSMHKMGIYVDSVGTGAEALAKIEEAHRRGEDYDAAFLDWKMPDMNGPDTAKKIRAGAGKELPILIVSAYDWSDIEQEAQAAGVDGFVSKPLFASTLCRALRKYVLGRDEDSEAGRQNDENQFLGRRFLLAEDNDLNREIAVELLEGVGAAIECAKNGAECFALFEKAPPEYYDLILMDIQMPVMNGYEATGKIRGLPRADAKEIPILAMTADAFAEDVEKAKRVGMNGHLAKPLNTAMMKREIHAALRVADAAKAERPR